MWQIEPTSQWDRDRKYYEKKRPGEFAAVLRNLERYLALLNQAPNAKAVQAGYLHHEPAGVVAIDQKGGGASLQETRLYTFAKEPEQVIYLITIGNKDDQPSDIAFARDFVHENFPQKPPTEPT
jgi:hypothetical protein